ncbi:unnamed protein product [Urochloa humidicola]
MKPAHWRLRPLIAEIISNSAHQISEFCKIPRQLNKTAHRLAKQARQSVPQPCTFICNNQSHAGHCPVLQALQNSSWGSFYPLSVFCC